MAAPSRDKKSAQFIFKGENMHIVVGGIPREVNLTLMDCNSILKRWNMWYGIHVLRIKAMHENKYLPQIKDAENDPERHALLIKEYQNIVDRDFVNLEVPFEFIITALWRILAPHEKKRFKNRIFPTRNKTAKKRFSKCVLVNEYETLAHFVGEQLLNMPGYKKKS